MTQQQRAANIEAQEAMREHECRGDEDACASTRRGYAAWALSYAARCRRKGFYKAARHAVRTAMRNRLPKSLWPAWTDA